MENVRETDTMTTGCQVCEDVKDIEADAPQSVNRIYVLKFNVQGVGKGNAVIKAPNPNTAGSILKSNGVFNGTPFLYKIKKIEELVIPPCAGIMAESVLTIKEVMEDSYVS